MTSEELLTPDEAARELRAAASTLARWRSDGNGPPYIKRRGRVFYRRQEITDFVSGCERQKTREDA